MKNWIATTALMLASLGLQAQTAPVKAEGAWARASVQGQSGTGAFMVLNASEPVTLVGARTPAAGVAEVHEMKMEGDVMRMRAVEGLPIAPGKPLELKPGGFHIMLMQLKAPLKAGTQVPLTLQFRDAKGATSQLELQVPVSVQAGNMQPGMHHKH
jgi:periplasmic copper chaperone A